MKTFRNDGKREINTNIGPHRYVIAPGAFAAIPDKYAYVPASHGLPLVEAEAPVGVEVVRGAEADPRLESLLGHLSPRDVASARKAWASAGPGERKRMLRELRDYVERTKDSEGAREEAEGGFAPQPEADSEDDEEAPVDGAARDEEEGDEEEDALNQQLLAAATATGRKPRRRAPTN